MGALVIIAQTGASAVAGGLAGFVQLRRAYQVIARQRVESHVLCALAKQPLSVKKLSRVTGHSYGEVRAAVNELMAGHHIRVRASVGSEIHYALHPW